MGANRVCPLPHFVIKDGGPYSAVRFDAPSSRLPNEKAMAVRSEK